MGIVNNTDNNRPGAFLSLGFRPFFVGASLYALISILIWMSAYSLHHDAGINYLSPQYWHAHEMIFGYAMAVIAGFLLTAVSNWTGLRTATAYPLLLLFALWTLARLLPFIPLADGLSIMFAVDCLFGISLLYAISRPVFKSRQWQQAGLLAKVALLVIANVIFYLGAMDILDNGMRWGIYAGLYLVIALILMMARRVMPFFIEKGCGLTTPLKNWRWLDLSSLIIFLCFMIGDIIQPSGFVASLLALTLAVLHGLRLYLWHIGAIWRKPLLWVLFIAYAFIILGFILKTTEYFLASSPFLALHAFALGGIGIMTIGMMARVSLGHTGRRVDAPPPVLAWIFLLMITAATARVILPLLDPAQYMLWVLISQLLWIGAFAGFILVYLPVLIRKNIDNDQ